MAQRSGWSSGRARSHDRSVRSRTTVLRASTIGIVLVVASSANDGQQDDGQHQNGSTKARGQQRYRLRAIGPLSHHARRGALAAGLHTRTSRGRYGSRCSRVGPEGDACGQIRGCGTGRRRSAILTCGRRCSCRHGRTRHGRNTAGRVAGGMRGNPWGRCLRRGRRVRLRCSRRCAGSGRGARRRHHGSARCLLCGIGRAWSHGRGVARHPGGRRRRRVGHLRRCSGTCRLSGHWKWCRRACRHRRCRWLDWCGRWCRHRRGGGIRVRLRGRWQGSGRLVARDGTTVSARSAWLDSRQLPVVLGASAWVRKAILGGRDFVKHLCPLGSARAWSNASYSGSSSIGCSRDLHHIPFAPVDAQELVIVRLFQLTIQPKPFVVWIEVISDHVSRPGFRPPPQILNSRTLSYTDHAGLA